MTIFPFLAILTPVNPPISRRTKHWGTSGVHLRVPTLPPDSTPSPNFRHHTLFSLGGPFGTPHHGSHQMGKNYLFFLNKTSPCRLILLTKGALTSWLSSGGVNKDMGILNRGLLTPLVAFGPRTQ